MGSEDDEDAGDDEYDYDDDFLAKVGESYVHISKG